jgi:hypothetical protein
MRAEYGYRRISRALPLLMNKGHFEYAKEDFH